MRRDPLAFYTRCARTYGDCFLLRFGLRRVYFLSHPDLVEEVLVNRARNFTKHYALRMNRRVLGNGLLTSDGDFWLRQRRLIQPTFLRERVADYGRVVVQKTERLLAGWKDGDTRDLLAEMKELTMQIIAQVLFDADVTGRAREVGRALNAAMASFPRRLFRVVPVPDWLPTPTNLRLWWGVRRLDRILYGLIGARRAGDGRDDLLAHMLRARDEDGGGRMTDRQLRDEAMTLFLAGHDTTALALTWAWYLLSRHPGEAEKLRGELREVLSGRTPTVADLPRLRYAEMVVQEAMRLYPPAYALGRQSVESCELAGYRVPAGSTVLMSQWVIQRDPRFFEEPEVFAPARWADGLAQRLPHYAYFPFGGGPRVCIGNSFALMEAVLILATVARRFRFTPATDAPVRPRPALTLQPERGIEVVVHELAPGGG